MSIIEAAAMRCRTMADGSLRVEFEIEPRHAQAAFALFGSPGTPAALAALKVGHAAKSDKPVEETANKGGELARLAGRLCREPTFVEFIRPVYDKVVGGTGKAWGDVSPDDFGGSTEEYARHVILVICGVDSRAELDHKASAAALFHERIRKPYTAWQSAGTNRERATA